MSTEDLLFPVFEYHLDESDPDIVVLRRQDDTCVAAFSTKGVTPEGIVEAAKEDYRELLRVYRSRQAHHLPQPLEVEVFYDRAFPVPQVGDDGRLGKQRLIQDLDTFCKRWWSSARRT